MNHKSQALNLNPVGITINLDKCRYIWEIENKVLRFEYQRSRINADPDKANALNNIIQPNTKVELITFICMMHSNTEFIPNLAKESAVLRDL